MSYLARLGAQSFDRTVGRGRYNPDVIARAQEEGLAANRAYMMSAPAWERDGWVMGAAQQAQDADLAVIDADTDSVWNRLGGSLTPIGASDVKAAYDAAVAAGRAEQAETAAGIGRNNDTIMRIRDAYGEPVMPGDVTGADMADQMALARGNQAAAEVMRAARDKAAGKVADVFGTPVDGDMTASLRGRRGGSVRDRVGEIGALGQERAAAAADLNQYARMVAPALGIDPMLAAGLYATDPSELLADQVGAQKYANYLETGDPSGRSAGDITLDQYRDQRDYEVMQDDMTGRAVSEANITAMADNFGVDPADVADTLSVDSSLLRAATSDPRWPDYEMQLEMLVDEYGDDMPSWTEVKADLDAAGLEKPSGQLESALSAYYRFMAGG